MKFLDFCIFRLFKGLGWLYWINTNKCYSRCALYLSYGTIYRAKSYKNGTLNRALLLNISYQADYKFIVKSNIGRLHLKYSIALSWVSVIDSSKKRLLSQFRHFINLMISLSQRHYDTEKTNNAVQISFFTSQWLCEMR